jgi:hypothetical protein
MGTGKRPPPAEPARNGTADELTPKQEAAAVAMAGGATYEQAAEASGAGVTTVKTWAAEVPAFRARIARLRAELSARVMGRVTAGMWQRRHATEGRGGAADARHRADGGRGTEGPDGSTGAGGPPMSLRDIRNRLDRLTKQAARRRPIVIDWDALLRGDWEAFAASLPEPPDDLGDPYSRPDDSGPDAIEQRIARVAALC